MEIKIGTRVVYDGDHWIVKDTKATAEHSGIQFRFQLEAIGTHVGQIAPTLKWLNANDIKIATINMDGKEIIRIVPRDRISLAEAMDAIPMTAEEKRTCPRCKKVDVTTLWHHWIDNEVENVFVCDECGKELKALNDEFALARNAYVRMLYEHPGHGKKAPSVVGHVVMAARRIAKDELEKFGWEDNTGTMVLVLSNGTVLIPSSNWEKNDIGVLFGISYEGNLLEFE